MKHLIRTQTSKGFGLPDALPDTLVITHVGSGQQFTQAVDWRKTGSGGQSAANTFAIPPAAKLGVYQVELRSGKDKAEDEDGRRSYATGLFRVEEFRLPVLEGRVTPSDKAPLVAITALPTDVQINYVAGGGAANLPVRVSAMVRGKRLDVADYDSFSFSPPRKRDDQAASDADEEDASSDDTRVIADKLPLTLDRNGAGKLTIDKVPLAKATPRELLIEATYSDPNGEVQTIRSTQTLRSSPASRPKAGSRPTRSSSSRRWRSTSPASRWPMPR